VHLYPAVGWMQFILTKWPHELLACCLIPLLQSVDSYLLMDAVATNHSESIEQDRLGLLSSYIVSQLLHGLFVL
jgi:hypothetical protein